MPYLPPDLANAVTHIKAQTFIDAPAQTVWEAILDFASYPKWNSVVRYQVIIDPASRLPLLEQPRPTEGALLLLHLRIPPRGLDDDGLGLRVSHELITCVDEANHRVIWGVHGFPRWLFWAQRWQEVKEEQVDGRTVTKYETLETFNGPLAWVIYWFMRKDLVASFEAIVLGLKTYSESLAKGT